jgi:hypothetical protein
MIILVDPSVLWCRLPSASWRKCARAGLMRSEVHSTDLGVYVEGTCVSASTPVLYGIRHILPESVCDCHRKVPVRLDLVLKLGVCFEAPCWTVYSFFVSICCMKLGSTVSLSTYYLHMGGCQSNGVVTCAKGTIHRCVSSVVVVSNNKPALGSWTQDGSRCAQ